LTAHFATEGTVSNCQRSVLIVDRSEETREVLQTVLERRGVRTLAASEPGKAAELARQNQVDLVVLDVESCPPDVVRVVTPAEPGDSSSETSVRLRVLPSSRPHAERGGHRNVQPHASPHMILLGRVRKWRGDAPDGEFVAKPYHYGPLIRRIEELLGLSMPPSGSVVRGDAVCHSRSRSGQSI
jgi:hypothetical protein